MKQLILCSLVMSVAALATPLTPVRLIDAGHPLESNGREYVGPYTLELNGHSLAVLCVDYLDEAKPNDQWTAYLSPLTGDFEHAYYPGDLIQYQEEAYLYTQIVQPGADRIALQAAAWAITDAAFEPSKAAAAWIARAEREYATVDLTGFAVISDAAGRFGARRQEFIARIDVPEPGLLSLLTGLVLVAVALVRRRRG